MTKLRFRPAQPEDMPVLRKAFREVFNTYRSLAEWQWIYQENPHGAHIMLGWHNDELTACYACTVHQAIWQDRTVHVGHIRDVFTVPAYRSYTKNKLGLFAQVCEAFVDTWANPRQLIFLYGFPSLKPFKLGKLIKRYHAFSDWKAYAYPIQPVLSSFMPKNLVQQVTAISTEFETLWQHRQPYLPFAVQHDAAFLRWRFKDSHKYWIWTCQEYLSKHLSGYVVLASAGQTAYLVDFCWPENLTTGQDFWLQVSTQLHKQGITRVETWCAASNPDIHIAFSQLGFMPVVVRRDLFPVYGCFHPDLENAWADQHFFFNMADSDLY